jgi:hypothetical protein
MSLKSQISANFPISVSKSCLDPINKWLVLAHPILKISINNILFRFCEIIQVVFLDILLILKHILEGKVSIVEVLKALIVHFINKLSHYEPWCLKNSWIFKFLPCWKCIIIKSSYLVIEGFRLTSELDSWLECDRLVGLIVEFNFTVRNVCQLII